MLPNTGYNLKISKFIQFGNTLIQLTNAINVALETKSNLQMPTITNCPESMDMLKTLPNLNFKEGGCNETIESKFFFPEETFNYEITNERRRELLSEFIYPHLNLETPEINDDTLVIHIRSGDIFGGWIHKNYVQPPLSFYKKIILETDSSDILIVTQEDKKNPCINELVNWDPRVRVQTGSLVRDVSAILKAKKLVIGFGSFGWMLSLLSKNLEVLFCPEIVHDQLSSHFDNDPFHIRRYNFENYIKMGDWNCTEEQKKLMIGDVNVIEL